MDQRRHVDSWLAAWNSHDLDAIMSCYSEHVDFVASTVIQDGTAMTAVCKAGPNYAATLNVGWNLPLT